MSSTNENDLVVHLPVVKPAPLAPSPLVAPATAASVAATGVANGSASSAAVADPSPVAGSLADPAGHFEKKLLEGRVIEAIRQIYDPEIPVNIYELGLIYKIDVKDDHSVHVQMTLTAPACPVAGSLPGQVEQKIESVPEVKSATVELVWEPPWSRDMMSEEAQLQLGLM